MRLLSPFFSINKEISVDLVIKFNLEQDTKKLFEARVAHGAENVDRNPRRTRPILFEAPKIHHNTYTFTPRKAAIHDLVMGRTKTKRTGVQRYYHGKKLIVRQNGFGGMVNFNNTGTQFKWLIISIIPVLSKEYRNTYATYNAEQANHFIRKITISIIKDAVGTTTKVYDLTEFNDQLTILGNTVYTLPTPLVQTHF